MNSIIFLCRLACASWIRCLRTSGSELWCALGFEISLPVCTVLGALVGSPLGYSTNMLIVMKFGNYFETWEGYLFGVSLGTLYGLIIGTREGSLFGLSLRLPLGSPLEFPNTRYIVQSFHHLPLGRALLLPCKPHSQLLSLGCEPLSLKVVDKVVTATRPNVIRKQKLN